MLNRSERLARELQRLLNEGLRTQYGNQAVRITITDTKLSDDWQKLSVFYSVIGGPQDRAQARKNLHAWSKNLRHYLGRHIVLKFLPSLNFQYDDSLERGSRIVDALDDLNKNSLES